MSNPESPSLSREPSRVSSTDPLREPAIQTLKASDLGPDGPSVKLSVAFIVKNEAHIIGPLLKQASKFADELIVVDTGSTDDTKKVAARRGAKVFDFEWIEDFSAARNFAFSKCTNEWIMWLDADDYVTYTNVGKIRELKKVLATEQFAEIRTVFCPYHYEFDANGNLAVNLNRERFLRNGVGHEWIGRIHETIAEPWAKSIRVEDIIIEHRPPKVNQDRKPGRNLRIFESYIDVETCTLRELFLFGSELLQAARQEEAIKAFEVYLRRSKELPDPVGELYATYIKLADALHQTKRTEDGIEIALRAVRIDPTRAEGYCVAGVLYMFKGDAKASFPLLMAACACSLPPPHISLVVHKLYSDVPLQCSIQLMRELFKSKDPADRMFQVGSVLKQLAEKVFEAPQT